MSIAKEYSLKEKILHSSRNILASEGYNGLSMRKIANLVNCKAASIYHHFENKDKIVHYLIDEGFQLQFEATEKAIKEIENPIERIELRARTYIEFGLNYPEYYHIMYVLYTKDMERYPKENYRRNSLNVSKTVEDLEAANEQGLIELKSDAMIIANAGYSMLHGLVSLILTNRLHIKLDKEQIKEMVVQQVVKMYE